MPPKPKTGLDAIEHVIVLMLERTASFDHVLGDFAGGVDPKPPRHQPRDQESPRPRARPPPLSRRRHPSTKARTCGCSSRTATPASCSTSRTRNPDSTPTERHEVMRYPLRKAPLPAMHAARRPPSAVARAGSRRCRPRGRTACSRSAAPARRAIKDAVGAANLNRHWYDQTTVVRSPEPGEQDLAVYFHDSALVVSCSPTSSSRATLQKHHKSSSCTHEPRRRRRQVSPVRVIEPAYFSLNSNDCQRRTTSWQARRWVAEVYQRPAREPRAVAVDAAVVLSTRTEAL